MEIKKVGRNNPCPCGSGKKFKYCHGPLTKRDRDKEIEEERRAEEKPREEEAAEENADEVEEAADAEVDEGGPGEPEGDN